MLKKSWSINKDVAPKTFKEFGKWYKLACHIPDVSVEEAFQSLGYKLPKKDVRTDTPTEKKK